MTTPSKDREKDVPDAELAVLQVLWDQGPAAMEETLSAKARLRRS